MRLKGCLKSLLIFWVVGSILGVTTIAAFKLYLVNENGYKEEVVILILATIIILVFVLIVGIVLYKILNRKKKIINPIFNRSPYAVELFCDSKKGSLILNNPFRGILTIGAAGSGKSESIGIPLIYQFVNKSFSGIVYDFKFPSLANEVQTAITSSKSHLKHFYLNFNNPGQSHRVNPLNPDYLPNTSYAREYAQAIINNLIKESIRKPDFWSRSATDLLTACIWYLKEEHPHMCDLPHVCAMITSSDTALLKTLQTNSTSAQMTISIYNTMQREAQGQIAGVIGTLQGSIAQINTPELMYIFGQDDFSLDINDPQNPIILTVGTYPTLVTTLAPLCSLVITVPTKLMNQPNKHRSFVLLDEAPTVFIPNIEILPNTGRSNKIATVIMCQDLAQLHDGYGKEKADVLFASCNNHFYGRVASSHTREILSKQFGKEDRMYVTRSSGKSYGMSMSQSRSVNETVQERDAMKASEFLKLGVGQFVGIAVESNSDAFRFQFKQVNRLNYTPVTLPEYRTDIDSYYKQVRKDIDIILGVSKVETFFNADSGTPAKLNHTQTNSKEYEKTNPFDIFGD